MILADKIIKLRKERGWSQEELAMKLNVSRQSVSKWESMASIPDLDKIIKLSEMFGVSTDYLLRDDVEVDPNAAGQADVYEPTQESIHTISLEEANAYMAAVAGGAKKLTLAIAMCIVSPVILIIMAGLAEYKIVAITEDMAAGFGVSVLFVFLAFAVAIFVFYGMNMEKYEFLEQEWIALEYGVKGIVEKKKMDFEPSYRKGVVLGISGCIVAVVPIMLCVSLGLPEIYCVYGVAALLVIIAFSVAMITYHCSIWESYAKLLEEGDYTRTEKTENKKNATIASAYWLAVVAFFLAISFVTMRWDRTWIIWPVAGVSYGVLVAILKAVRSKKRS